MYIPLCVTWLYYDIICFNWRAERALLVMSTGRLFCIYTYIYIYMYIYVTGDVHTVTLYVLLILRAHSLLANNAVADLGGDPGVQWNPPFGRVLRNYDSFVVVLRVIGALAIV